MIWLTIIAVAVLICFAAVVLFGAPYVPTLKPQVKTALELADLKKGQTMLELGCGDGKVMVAAAKQGINTIGYELNPLLAVIAWLRTRRYYRHATVIWGDFWRKPWPEAEAIFTFLLPKYMEKLDKKVIRYEHKPVKLVSFAFTIDGRRAKTAKNGVYLYIYR